MYVYIYMQTYICACTKITCATSAFYKLLPFVCVVCVPCCHLSTYLVFLAVSDVVILAVSDFVFLAIYLCMCVQEAVVASATMN